MTTEAQSTPSLEGQATPSQEPQARPIEPICPRCNRAAEPGTIFVGTTGTSEYGACPNCGTPLVLPGELAPEAYEEKAVSCAAFDLERVARAEAADGWALLDTTVDDRAPSLILAHFRRPARAGAIPAAPARPAPLPATPAPAKSTDLGPDPAAAPSQARRRGPAPPKPAAAPPAEAAEPGPSARPTAPSDSARVAFAILMVLGTLFLIWNFKWIGFFIALALLPKLLRSFLGLPDPKSDSQRSRNRQRRRD